MIDQVRRLDLGPDQVWMGADEPFGPIGGCPAPTGWWLISKPLKTQLGPPPIPGGYYTITKGTNEF